METVSLPKLTSHIEAQAKRCFVSGDAPGVRQSRKVQGMLDSQVEGHGLGTLWVYLEKGLARRADLAGKILDNIDGRIRWSCEFPYARGVISFGWPEGLHLGKHSHFNKPDRVLAPMWRDLISDIAGSELPQHPLLIPSLTPSGPSSSQFHGKKPTFYGGNFLLFFCESQDVSMTPECLAQYGKLRKNAAWVFLQPENDNEVLLEKGTTFSPRPEQALIVNPDSRTSNPG